MIYLCRKVKFVLCDKLRKQLAIMEELQIKQNNWEPTKWVSSPVTVEKSNEDVISVWISDALTRLIKREH